MEAAGPNVVVTLERSSPVPLYHQLASELEQAVADGRLPKGSYLDNELALVDQWQVSRPTVRRAIQALVDKGLLVRRRGIGTQVVSDELRPQAKLNGLWDDLAREGRTPTTTVLAHHVIIPDDAIARLLELPPGTPVVYLERCRYADGQRLAILRNHLPVDIMADIDTADLVAGGLYDLLRTKGVWPHHASQEIGARAASPVDAALLGLPVGAPLMTMRRIMRDRSGRTVDIGDHVYNALDYSLESSIVEV